MAALFCRYLAKLGWRTSIAGSGYLTILGRLQSLAAPRGLTARLAPAAAAVAMNFRRCMVSRSSRLGREKAESRNSKIETRLDFRVSLFRLHPLHTADDL